MACRVPPAGSTLSSLTAEAPPGASAVALNARNTMRAMPTRDQIMQALEAVIDPELRDSIVALDMVRSIDVHEDGQVGVMVSLTTPGCPIRSHFQQGVVNAVQPLEGVTKVNVAFDVLNDQQKQ